MTEKNIFAFKRFLSLNISDFIFYGKIETPPEKSHPPLSQQPPTKSLGPVKPPFLKIWLEVHPPPKQKGGRCTLCTDQWCNMLQILPERKKYDKGISDEQPLIKSVFWVIAEITFTNLYEPIHDVIIISVLYNPLNDKMWKGKGKIRNIEYLENEQSFLDEIKTIFGTF